MSTQFIKEACVEGIDQALAAQDKGADRIELCSDLANDGLTPGIDVIMEANERVNIPIRVMIRPRSGGFVYSREEVQEMVASIEICKSLGMDGVVFGLLKEDQTVDLEKVKFLCGVAGDMKTVFHKAIEETPNVLDSAQALFEHTPIDAILTTGGAGKAVDHLSELRELIAAARNKELVVCGKITDQNLPRIHEALNAKAYHGRKILGTL